MENILLVRPYDAHSAYSIASDIFAELAQKTAGANVGICCDDAVESLPCSNQPIVVIGSDAVNRLSTKLYFEYALDSFDIRYCTDDYSIITTTWQNHPMLVISGGRPRAVIYAVYRYFELFCS